MVMKILFFLVCTLFISSCVKEQSLYSALSIKSVITKVNTRSFSADENKVEYDTVLWCHGNDIEWYNATTGELKLKNAPPPESLFSYISPNFFISLSIYLNDIQLLSFPYISPYSSASAAFPCIVTVEEDGFKWVGCQCGSKEQAHVWSPNCEIILEKSEYAAGTIRYFMGKSYPADEESEKKWKAIEPEWNIFINQLKKEGKYRK